MTRAAGWETEKFVPDFLTVKVTLHPDTAGPRDHHIVAIVEVKRNDMLRKAAQDGIKLLGHDGGDNPIGFSTNLWT